MRKTLFLFYLILGVSIFTLQAQDKKLIWGLATSLDANSYLLANKNTGFFTYKGRLNYSVGLVAKYELSSRFSLTGKLLYSTKNYKQITGEYRPLEPNDPIIIPSGFSTIVQNKYIDIPVELNYQLGGNEKAKFILTTGLVNSFRVNQADINALFGGYEKYLLSTKLGLGLFFKMQNIGIYIEPQTRFYLNSFNRLNRPTHFGIELQLLKI